MIDHTLRGGVTILQMRREPANILDLEFAELLETELRASARDGATGGVVLTGTKGVFSAGVDLFRLLEEDDGYLDGFLAALERLFETARAFPKPLVAALNGHAIAGGAVLALACDTRVMAAGTGRIGLPELRVGVPFPSSAMSIVRAVVPPDHLREVVLLGRTFDPADALARGLVDEVVPEPDVLDRAVSISAELAAAPARAFELTKRSLAARVEDDARQLDREVREVWADPATRARIASYLEATLGKRTR